MAIADFGGTVLGKPIEILTADHQNKPDIGQQQFWNGRHRRHDDDARRVQHRRQPRNRRRGSNQKHIPFFAIGAAGAQLDGHPVVDHSRRLRHQGAGQRHGQDHCCGRRQKSFSTADYAFGKQLEADASDIVKSGGGSVVGYVRVPLGTSDFSSYLSQAQGSGAQVLGLANAGADFSNSLKAAAEFGLTKSMNRIQTRTFGTSKMISQSWARSF